MSLAECRDVIHLVTGKIRPQSRWRNAMFGENLFEHKRDTASSLSSRKAKLIDHF